MEEKYYKEYAKLEVSHWWFKARSNILQAIVRKSHERSGKKVLNILNVGVATGQTTRMLEQFGHVTSLEYDENCCNYLKRIANIDVVQGSVTDLPFGNNAYDLVCAFDVIEHIEDDQRAIDEINRVVKKEGAVIISVPAYMFLWSEHDEINQHFRRYTMKNLQSLTRSRFEKEYISYFNFILFPLVVFVRSIRKLANSRDKDLKSDFDYYKTGGFLNKLFYFIFNLEKSVIGHLKIPFGVSILYVGTKR